MHFIFDANCSKRIAEGLSVLEEGNKKSPIKATVTHISKLTKVDATDEEVIDLVGRNNGILITYDKGFKSNKFRYQLYKQHNVGIIVFHSFKDVIYYWDIVKSFISKWEELKGDLKKDKIPFLYEISVTGFKKRDIDL